MNPLLRFLLGLDEGEVPAGGEYRWELSGMPQGSWLLLGGALVAACVALIVILYVRETELRPSQRLGLAALRIGALALIVLILLNPRILTEIHLTRPGKTLLLVDASASMSRRDRFGDPRNDALRRRLERATGVRLGDTYPTRTELLWLTLEHGEVLARLENNNRVALFSFASKLLPLGKIETAEDVLPQGEETRLGDALLEVRSHLGREPLAAVIVVTDGRTNAGEPPLDAARRLLQERAAPLYVVGVGKEELPRNLAVRELSAPDVAEVGFPVQIEARVVLSGAREVVRARLERTAEDGGGTTIVEERELEPERLLETRLKFIDELPRSGRYRYTLVLPELEGETERRDNRRAVEVSAVEEKRRLLLVAGNPSYEYRFVRNFALRDPGIQTSCWLSSADRGYPQDGDIVVSRLPESGEAMGEFDVVVLLDPEPETMTAPFQQALVDFVAEEGGGLAYVASEAHTPLIASEAGFRRFRALLPVELSSAAAATSGPHQRPWRPQLTRRGAEHPICLLLDDPEENRDLWSRLPSLYFAYPVGELRPGALSLLLTPEGAALAGLQRVGLGEVFYLGTDDLWQWRAAGVSVHERFWAGVIRYLALGKRQAGDRRVTIETDRDRYRAGDTVRVTVGLVDSRRRPVELPRLDATLEGLPSASDSQGEVGGTRAERPSRTSLTLIPVEGRPGRYSALFRASTPGHFSISLEPDGNAAFEVERLTTELEDTSPDFVGLEAIAALSGGGLLDLGDLADLAEEIPETSVTEVLGRRATTIWDSTSVMLLFSGLLILEWVLRKLWRLN